MIIACCDLLTSCTTGVIASLEVALQRAAGMLHDRQLCWLKLLAHNHTSIAEKPSGLLI